MTNTGTAIPRVDTITLLLGKKSTKTADYTILTFDERDIIELGFANAAIRTFTLPASPPDGFMVNVMNDSMYNLIVKTGDSVDFVWNSGAGYGIELPERGTIVVLRYDDSNTKWDIVNKTGGRVLMEGLVLDEPMQEISVYATGAANVNTRAVDLTRKTNGYLYGNLFHAYGEVGTGFQQFDPGCWILDGAGDYALYPDSPDWDIFGTQTGHKTVACWVRFDALGSPETFLDHYEDGNNRWKFLKNAANALQLAYTQASTTDINISGGSISAATWHHVALVLDGIGVGIYLDGVQVAWDNVWDADTFAGSLNVGRSGGAAEYLDGRMQDLHISYNNPYGAAPNATPDDTFTVPAAPFQGVML